MKIFNYNCKYSLGSSLNNKCTLYLHPKKNINYNTFSVIVQYTYSRSMTTKISIYLRNICIGLFENLIKLYLLCTCVDIYFYIYMIFKTISNNITVHE